MRVPYYFSTHGDGGMILGVVQDLLRLSEVRRLDGELQYLYGPRRM